MGYSSDLTQGKTFSASTASADAYKAFDNNDSTMWAGSKEYYTGYIKVDFGSAVKIAKVVIKHFAYMSSYKLQGSNNDSAWTDVYTMTGMTANGTYTFEFTNTTAYRYYRVLSTAYAYMAIYTLQMFSLSGYNSPGTYVTNAIDATTIPDCAIHWTADKPTNTDVSVGYAFNQSDSVAPTSWTSTTSGAALTMPESLSGYYLWIKVTLTTTDSAVTPTLTSLYVTEAEADASKIKVVLTADGRLKYPQGDVSISFSGSITGVLGSDVEPFVATFTPTIDAPIFNPNDAERIDLDPTITATMMQVYYEEYQTDDESIEITPTITVTMIHVDDLEQ